MSLPEPYYVSEDGRITIYHGDCREILPLLDPVDLVLTDPPYGKVNRASSGLRSLNKGDADTATMTPDEIASALIPVVGGSVYVWCGTEQVSGIRAAFVASKMSTRLGIWEKTNPSPMNGEYLWLSGLEACVYGKRPRATFTEFCKSPIWRGPTTEVDTTGDHQTPKPEWLMRRLVQASSNPGDMVLDPFMGSGTTLRAAADLGRRAIGIEINEDYCRIAVERLRQGVLL
jgi:site-specific DNA-methyltransferase (adenine-specific)